VSIQSQRVLILTVTEKDSVATADLIQRMGYDSFICRSVDHLCFEIGIGVGAIIVAKEVLQAHYVQKISTMLNSQPAWSFPPLILLIASGDLSKSSEKTLNLLAPLRNITLLERPVRISTMSSVIKSALSDRARQYELRDLLEALQKSKEEAVQANKSKTEFLANMSHEIRTPLGAILGFAELLTESGIPEHEKEPYISAIQRNGELLTALIDDVLDLSKVEAGRIEMEVLVVEIKELVTEVVTALKSKIAARNIQILVNFESNVPSFIKIDPIRLKQILINIIGNAIKFTSEGVVTMHVLLDESDVGSKLIFEITDNGLGISPEQSKKLFQPFTQADSSVTRKFGGTGLGLALSRKLAQALGGDLVLKESIPGNGSTFRISVSLDRVGPYQIGLQQVSPRSDPAQPSLAGLKVLLADDSRDNQIFITRILKLAGAVVETANDGAECVRKAQNGNYDVVLMDIQMPVMSGLDATKTLRSHAFIKPIIALTANALKEDRDRCLQAGCTKYLTKPIKRGELIQALIEERPLTAIS
jgi:signal transduction histidine kinase